MTVSSLSHLTECHSIYLLKLPLPEAEDSSKTLLVPYWCHLVSGSALIIFHLSSNSPQTDCCSIITIISFYPSCFPPSKFSKIMNTVREEDKGTLLPKTIFNINEKCRRLIDLANGILPTCTDAEKTLKLLEL